MLIGLLLVVLEEVCNVSSYLRIKITTQIILVRISISNHLRLLVCPASSTLVRPMWAQRDPCNVADQPPRGERWKSRTSNTNHSHLYLCRVASYKAERTCQLAVGCSPWWVQVQHFSPDTGDVMWHQSQTSLPAALQWQFVVFRPQRDDKHPPSTVYGGTPMFRL